MTPRPRAGKARPGSGAGPGLAKAQGGPRPSARKLTLWRSSDSWWRLLFERADVMSEGAVRQEGNARTYFGTTSILLHAVAGGGLLDPQDLPSFRPLVSLDPHARVRAIRVACREAQVRAELPLKRINAHLRAVHDPRGLRLDVDVDAALHQDSSTPKPRTDKPVSSARSQSATPPRRTKRRGR